jgi:hypothetical protein
MNELSSTDLTRVTGGGVTGESSVAYDLAYVASWVIGAVGGFFSSSSIPANWHSGTMGFSANNLK